MIALFCVSAAEREANPVPNVQDCVQKIIKEIVTKNFSYKVSYNYLTFPDTPSLHRSKFCIDSTLNFIESWLIN